MKTVCGYIKSFSEKNKNTIRLLSVLALVFVLLSIFKSNLFLKTANFQSMAIQFPEFAILSLGVALTLISGGIDLSVVGISNLAGVCMAIILSRLIPENASGGVAILFILLAVVCGFCIGVACGAVNGLLVTKFNMPPILATMGSMQMFTGLALVITEGRAVSGLVPIYSKAINAQVFGYIPVPLFFFIGCAIWISILLNKTNYGQKLYMLGTNKKAATYSGVNTSNILMRTYILSGVLAIFASLIMMGRTNSAKSDVGTSYTLQCVLICVLGGVKTEGGYGKISGIVIAVLVLQMISSGLNMFQEINNFYRGLIWGIVLVAVLIINVIIEKREKAKYLKRLGLEAQAG